MEIAITIIKGLQAVRGFSGEITLIDSKIAMIRK